MKNNLHSTNYDTDKNEVYLSNYQRYFEPIKYESINLLELGVLRGGSLLFWRDYFPNGTIVGVDINPTQINDHTGRIHIYQGFQQDKKFLDYVRNSSATDGFDIIIDDASHIGELTRISFWHLFNYHLKPGGLYVIEDWRMGYWHKFIDGKNYKWLKKEEYIRNSIQRLIDSLLTQIGNMSNGTKLCRLSRLFLEKTKNLTYKKRFRSHDFGMVGFVKELVDELGMDMITNPARGSKIPQRVPKFVRMEICPGQVFVIKNSLL